MSKLNVKVPHQLARQEAIDRIKKLMGDLQKDHKDIIKNVSEQWDGNHSSFNFTAKGFDISGTLDIEADEVIVKGNLPFMLSFFKGKIEDIIRDKAGELLAT